MLRAKTTVPPGVERWYTPRAFGNHLSTTPCRVLIKNPSERVRRRCFAAMPTGEDGEPDLTDDNWRQIAIEACVLKVENYKRLSVEGEELVDVPIETGADLFEHGDGLVVKEVAGEILTAISLGEEGKKKSSVSSGSAPAATQPSPGTAVNAGSKDSAVSDSATPPDQSTPTSPPSGTPSTAAP